MKSVVKPGLVASIMLIPEETVTRVGTLGIVAGGILSLFALMF